jgi:hypothetical protein
VREVPSEALSPVIEAWAERVLQRLDRYLVAEFELAIVEPLLEVASEDVRLPILRNLLGVADTGARVVTTKWLVASWDTLSAAEHALIEAVLREARGDTHWLAATVLTLRDPPQPVVAALTGDHETLLLAPDEIEAKLGAELFSACVYMYAGWPQPLWWYATHHSRNATWTRVIRQLARTPDHPLHAVAFYEIANFGKERELADLIRDLPKAVLGDTFERLLDFKIAHVGDWRCEAWQQLLARADKAQLLDAFIARIDTELEGILEDMADIRWWLGEDDLATRIEKLLPNDGKAIIRAGDLRKAHTMMQEQLAETGGADQATAAEMFARLCAKQLIEFESEPPRLHGTWGRIGQTFKDIGATAEACSAVDAHRLKAIESYRAIRQGFKGAPPHFELPGWIDQAHRRP